jgi:hypothetical protein
MPITISEKRDQFTKFLIKELGSVNSVKDFSQQLRDAGICDLRNDKDFENVTKDGAPMLMSLLTWYNFGFLNKFIEIKQKIKEEK